MLEQCGILYVMKLPIVMLATMLAAQVVLANELWWTEEFRLKANVASDGGEARTSWNLPLVAASSEKGTNYLEGRVVKPSELGDFVEVGRISGVSFSAYSFCVELMRSRELLTKLKSEEARKVASAYEEMSQQLSPDASPEPSGATLVALGLTFLGLRRVRRGN